MATSYQFEVQTIQEGTGEQCPVGATAELHYTGRLLDGTVFDSSIPKGRTFKFKVGAG
jgi:FKBP-type peptidyl-prolyl cis-trans isomerase